MSSGALSSLLKIWEEESREKKKKAGALGWMDGTQGEVINSELCWSWFPQDHLAAIQNASNEVQSDVLSCWRTNAKQLWGYTLTSVLIHKPVVRLKEYSCVVRGCQTGSLYYPDGIRGHIICSSQGWKRFPWANIFASYKLLFSISWGKSRQQDCSHDCEGKQMQLCAAAAVTSGVYLHINRNRHICINIH